MCLCIRMPWSYSKVYIELHTCVCVENSWEPHTCSFSQIVATVFLPLALLRPSSPETFLWYLRLSFCRILFLPPSDLLMPQSSYSGAFRLPLILFRICPGRAPSWTATSLTEIIFSHELEAATIEDSSTAWFTVAEKEFPARDCAKASSDKISE